MVSKMGELITRCAFWWNGLESWKKFGIKHARLREILGCVISWQVLHSTYGTKPWGLGWGGPKQTIPLVVGAEPLQLVSEPKPSLVWCNEWGCSCLRCWATEWRLWLRWMGNPSHIGRKKEVMVYKMGELITRGAFWWNGLESWKNFGVKRARLREIIRWVTSWEVLYFTYRKNREAQNGVGQSEQYL